MVGFGEFLKNIKNGLSKVNPEGVRAGDDKVLEGLRRQRQRQIDEEEKKYLKVKIAEYEQDKTRRELYGAKKVVVKPKLGKSPKKICYYGKGSML